MASTLSGVATLTGTIIGSGILAIPFVAQKAGLWTGIAVIAALGLVMLLINLMLGEIMLKTKKHHQLTGYAEKYFGKTGKTLMALSVFIGIFGALSAQIIGEGEAISAMTGISVTLGAAIFYIIMSILIFQSIKVFEKSELLMGVIKAGLLAIILTVLFSYQGFSVENEYFSMNKILIPFGVVLFSLLGTSVIPEVRRELGNNTKKLRNIIILSSIIPIIVYILFTLAVIGATKGQTTEVATLGLASMFGKAGILMNLFAVITMATAYLGLSFAVKDMLATDYKIKESTSAFISILIPAIILLISKSFIDLISIAGAIGGGIAIVLILLMHDKKGDRTPEYKINMPKIIKYVLMALFILGAVAALIY